MDPNMQNMISYLKIKKLVGEEETQSYSEEEEEEEEKGLERESAVESRLKRAKVSLDEGGSRRRASATSRVPAGGGAVLVPPRCSVDNCGADLEGYKKYYQRHRVCEVHSKAPAVLVDGLRQRFCQQCSRFHDLSEFDHTKRSCRRRLAGHNLRRRKSSLEFQRGGPARMQGGNQQH